VSGASPPFDPNDPGHVAVFDEQPLWSAQAGLLLLEDVPLSAKRVLDLGCGAGFPLLELAERLGADAFVVGIDPWDAALKRAALKQRTWPVPHAAIVRGDGVRMPFRDGSLELVVSNLGVNNFSDPDAVLGEVRRILTQGGTLAFTTNRQGHFAELYEVFASVLATRDDQAALERLRVHVEHRGTVASMTERLERCGFRVASVHERTIAMRFASGAAIFDHHFLRLGFVPAWREVAADHADAVFAEMRAELDRRARGADGLRLTVPLVSILARPT
jgi:ubiquinone/menaquinone biosynthesis C-methylase UbiE